MNKKIQVIYTGGTIGGAIRGNHHEVLEEDLTPKVFRSYFSGVSSSLLGRIDLLPFITPVKKFSEEMTPTDWSLIAKAIYEAIHDRQADGVIIAHGTDTLAYTASALSFMLQGLSIPIVITGSNLPLQHPESDARRNLVDSVHVACMDQFKGVFVVFSGSPDKLSVVHAGVRVRKRASSPTNTFVSIGADPVAYFSKSILRPTPQLRFSNEALLDEIRDLQKKMEPVSIQAKVTEKVSFFEIYPGFNPEVITDAVQSNTRGLILNLYDSGTGCATSGKFDITSAIARATHRKIPVFATSQHDGSVRMKTYRSAVAIKEAGAIPLHNMTKEAAITKLMWARAIFPNESQNEELAELMTRNISGEISEGRDER